MDPRLVVLKIFMILGYIVLNFFLFLIFHNTAMMYNTRSPSHNATESSTLKKTCFNAHFQYSQSKITRLSKMWPLKS